MTVYIQRERGSGVAKIDLNGFDVNTVLKRQDSVGMTRVMHPGVWSADRCRQLLEMGINRLRQKTPIPKPSSMRV